MSPDEATRQLREHSLQLLESHKRLSSVDPLSTSPEVFYRLVLNIVERYAEFKWNVADIIDALTHPKFDITVGEQPAPQVNRQAPKIAPPPYAVDFFNSLPDF